MHPISSVRRPALRGRQRGLSLVEIAIGVAIAAGLLIGVITWVNRIQLDKQLNATRTDSASTMNAAIAAYLSMPNTAGANVAVLTAQNVWPADRVTNPGVAAATVRSHFKGSREFMFSNTADIGRMAANTGFIYTLYGVPAAACAQLVTALAAHPNAVAVYAGPQGVIPANGATPTVAAVKPADANLNLATVATAGACGGTAQKRVAVAFHRS